MTYVYTYIYCISQGTEVIGEFSFLDEGILQINTNKSMKKYSMFKIIAWDLFISQGLRNAFEIITLQKLIAFYRYLQKHTSSDISRKMIRLL